jgi:mitogen-activated protein kinase kinase kinase 9
MEIPCLCFEDYEDLGLIGKGKYSDVTLAKHKATGEIVAIKTFTFRQVDERYEIDFMREISILGILKHPVIIKFYGFSAPAEAETDELRWAYAIEYVENGSLDSILEQVQCGCDGIEFGPTERMICMLGVGAALDYMHSHAVKDGFVVHRDIKAGNVLLDKAMKPRLCDFGFAKVITDMLPNTPNRGSWPWMAPEVMMGEKYGTKADVYSFGMLIFEIVVGMTPFVHMRTGKEIRTAVIERNERPLIPGPQLPIHAIIRRCWDRDPEKRPSIGDLLGLMLTQTIALEGCDMVRLLDYAQEIGIM